MEKKLLPSNDRLLIRPIDEGEKNLWKYRYS
jgi:hypothetical protein